MPETNYIVRFTSPEGGEVAATVNGRQITSGSQVTQGTTVVFSFQPHESNLTAWTLNWFVNGNASNGSGAANLLSVSVFNNIEVSLSATLTTVDIDPDAVPLADFDGVHHERYLWGYEDGTFRPDNNITRAEAAVIFFRIVDDVNKHVKRVSSFNDISDDDWYYEAVAYLEDKDILEGYEDGSFRPNDMITRAELVKMAIIFMRANQENTSHSFNDVASSHWALSYIATAASKGWIEGYGDGSFRPDDMITRAECVSIVNNLLNRKVEPEDIASNAAPFKDVPKSHWAYTDIMEGSISHDFTRKSNDFELWEK